MKPEIFVTEPYNRTNSHTLARLLPIPSGYNTRMEIIKKKSSTHRTGRQHPIVILDPVLILLLLITAVSANNTPRLNLEFIGHMGGSVEAVTAHGKHLYLGQGPAVAILDISKPSAPRTLGETSLLPGFVRDIAAHERQTYVVDTTGLLHIFDITDPAQPRQTATFQAPYASSGVAVAGNLVYLAAGEAGLRILDISQPTAPLEIGFLDTPGSARRVTIAAQIAYIADRDGGLRIVNVSDPNVPVEIAALETESAARAVVINDNFAYVVTFRGLQIINVADPASPFLAGRFSLSGQSQDVAVAGNYAYLVTSGYGLHIVDVSDPAIPIEVSSMHTADSFAVAVSSDHAYVAAGEWGLHTIDVNDPVHPTATIPNPTPGSVNEIAITADFAYTSDWRGHITIVDILNPADPSALARHQFPSNPFTLAAQADFLYLVEDETFKIFNVSDPINPKQSSTLSLPGYGDQIAVSGNLALIAVGPSGLVIVDISDPSRPFQTSVLPIIAGGVALQGRYAYLTNSAGLTVIDLRDPTAPVEVGFLATPTGHIAVNRDFVYTSTGAGSLRIIDVSNHAAPVLTAIYDTPGRTFDIAAGGNEAYIADGYGLRIINVADPHHPYESGYTLTPGQARALAVHAGNTHVAAFQGGMSILRFCGDAPCYEFYLPTLFSTVSGIFSINRGGGVNRTPLSVKDEKLEPVVG